MNRRMHSHDDFCRRVETQLRRARGSAADGSKAAWFGLGTVGVVGYTVALPTLLGIALGLVLDVHFREAFSWTLCGLALGVIVGASQAVAWLAREHGAIGAQAPSPPPSPLGTSLPPSSPLGTSPPLSPLASKGEHPARRKHR